MNLKKILSLIENYKKYLQSRQAEEELYKWESLKNFNENWNTEAEDLAGMYDRSFQNSSSRRQWKGNDFYPKEMMLKLIAAEPEYIRLALRDLFNDNKEIGGRVNRFMFYCDEVLNIYKTKNPKAKENNHYHTHEIVMMYLAFRFPEKYTLYNAAAFVHFLQSVDAKNISASHDLERFTKITKTINIFLKKDGEVQELLSKRLEEGKHFQSENVLAVHELMITNYE